MALCVAFYKNNLGEAMIFAEISKHFMDAVTVTLVHKNLECEGGKLDWGDEKRGEGEEVGLTNFC